MSESAPLLSGGGTSGAGGVGDFAGRGGGASTVLKAKLIVLGGIVFGCANAVAVLLAVVSQQWMRQGVPAKGPAAPSTAEWGLWQLCALQPGPATTRACYGYGDTKAIEALGFHPTTAAIQYLKATASFALLSLFSSLVSALALVVAHDRQSMFVRKLAAFPAFNSALCSFLAVCLFASFFRTDYSDRENEPARIGWSFGMCILGMLCAFISGTCVVLDLRSIGGSRRPRLLPRGTCGTGSTLGMLGHTMDGAVGVVLSVIVAVQLGLALSASAFSRLSGYNTAVSFVVVACLFEGIPQGLDITSIVLVLLSGLLDIVVAVLFGGEVVSTGSDSQRLALALTIFSLVLKPISVILMMIVFWQRRQRAKGPAQQGAEAGAVRATSTTAYDSTGAATRPSPAPVTATLAVAPAVVQSPKSEESGKAGRASKEAAPMPLAATTPPAGAKMPAPMPSVLKLPDAPGLEAAQDVVGNGPAPPPVELFQGTEELLVEAPAASAKPKKKRKKRGERAQAQGMLPASVSPQPMGEDEKGEGLIGATGGDATAAENNVAFPDSATSPPAGVTGGGVGAPPQQQQPETPPATILQAHRDGGPSAHVAEVAPTDVGVEPPAAEPAPSAAPTSVSVVDMLMADDPEGMFTIAPGTGEGTKKLARRKRAARREQEKVEATDDVAPLAQIVPLKGKSIRQRRGRSASPERDRGGDHGAGSRRPSRSRSTERTFGVGGGGGGDGAGYLSEGEQRGGARAAVSLPAAAPLRRSLSSSSLTEQQQQRPRSASIGADQGAGSEVGAGFSMRRSSSTRSLGGSSTLSGSTDDLSGRPRSGSTRSRSGSTRSRSGSTRSRSGSLRHTEIALDHDDGGYPCAKCGERFADMIIAELHARRCKG